MTDINEAWAELYDDKGFKDRRFTVRYPNDYPNFDEVTSDDGKKGFEDKTSSAKWLIPVGWQLVLFDDKNYKDSRFPLVGSGTVQENADLGSFSDKCSSCRWERV